MPQQSHGGSGDAMGRSSPQLRAAHNPFQTSTGTVSKLWWKSQVLFCQGFGPLHSKVYALAYIVQSELCGVRFEIV